MYMFNIRVYGVLQNKNGDVLVSDEFIRGNQYTKFPGGGLEFGALQFIVVIFYPFFCTKIAY